MSLEIAVRSVGSHPCAVLRNFRGAEEDLLRLAASLAEPRFAVARRWLIDNRDSDELPSRDDIRRLVGFATLRAEQTDGLAVAIIADRDAAYGMARMFEGFAHQGSLVARAFRDEGPALDWLAAVVR